MKLNKIMIVSFVLLAILTLGAVSATDNLTASETPDLDELGVSDADVPMEEDVGEEIGDEFEEEYREYVDYYSSCPDEYLIGDDTRIGMGIEYSVSGNVSIVLDGDEVYNQPVIKYYEDPDGPSSGGNYIYLNEFDNLDIGMHDYKIRYTGDDYYRPTTLEGSFEAAYIKIDVPDEVVIGSDFDDNDHITIKLACNATGNINVLIDDELFYSKSVSQAREDDNDWILIYLDNLTFGTHNYIVSYFGGNYDNVNESGEFSMSYYFDAYCDGYDHIEIGDETTVYVMLPSDFSSVPIAKLNNKTYEFEAHDDYCSLTLSDFTLGENIVQVSYQDEKYPLVTKNVSIYVDYIFNAPYHISWNSGDSFYMRLPRDAKGNLTLYERGEYDGENGTYMASDLFRTVSFNNGEASISLSDLPLGEYSFVVKYEGDDYEIEDVYKFIHVIPNVVYPAAVYIEDDCQLSVESPEDAMGNLNITIYSGHRGNYDYDDEELQFVCELYEGPAKGIVTRNLPNLDVGYYTIIVKYIEGSKPVPSLSYPFSVRDVLPNWTMEVNFPDVVVIRQDYENIIYYCPSNVPSGADGRLRLFIDGQYQDSVNFKNWDYYGDEYWYDGLSFGTHTWELKYSEDSYYSPTSLNGTFEVTWVMIPEEIEGEYDAEIYLGYSATGNVTVYLDGEKYLTEFLEDGEATLEFNDLELYKTYNYEIVYSGDEGHEQLTKTGSFTVTYLFDADFPYGGLDTGYLNNYEFYIYLPDDANGNVTAVVNNNTFEAEVIEGKAILILTGMEECNSYDITVKYNGDEKYAAREKVFTVWIDGYFIRSDYEANNLTYVALDLPSDASGNLIVRINDEFYESAPLADGFAKIFIDDLPLGYSKIFASYDSEDYDVNNYWLDFAKLPEMNITTEITEGDDCEIAIRLPNATGQLEIYVDYELYDTYDVIDGMVTATISDLESDEHTITFNYLGDEYYHLFTSYYSYDEGYEDSEPVEFHVYVNEDDENTPLEGIEFYLYEDDEVISYAIGDNVEIASLLIPAEENNDTIVTITITKNGKAFTTIKTSDIEPVLLESREAYQYPINLDLTQLNDKDVLEINVDCFDGDETIWKYVIEIDGDYAIFHWSEDAVEFYVFYGNITTGDLNDPELMGPHPNGDFIEFSIPDSYNVTEGSIVVTDGQSTILNKSLEECYAGFSYAILGNAYVITLDDFDLMTLPENKIITISLNYGNDSLTFKRVRMGDYIFKIITPDDVSSLFDIDIYDSDLYDESEIVLGILANDGANRQSIYIDIGGGHFNVYVNDTKIEGLGEIVLYNWISEAIYADEEYIEDLGIDSEVFMQLNEDEKISFLYDMFKDDFGNDIDLFRIVSDNQGCTELYLTLADLNITASGTYTIKITHIPELHEEEEPEPGEPAYLPDDYVVIEETLVLEKTVEVILGGPADSGLTINVSDINAGEDAIISILMDKSFTGDVLVSVDGVNYTVNVVNGSGNRTISGLDAGNYDVIATFANNAYFTPATAAASFIVNKAKSNNNTAENSIPLDDAKESKTPTYSINLPEDATGTLTVTIDGKNYTANVVNGKASITVTDLPAGSYDVTVTYSGDANYPPIVQKTSTTVVVDPRIVAQQTVALYTAKYSVTVYGKDGKIASGTAVTFKINGVTVKTVTTDSKGVASFNIPSKYIPKKYSITATALGKSASKTVTVKQILTVKTAKIKKSAKKVVITATLKKVDGKYLKGKTLKLKINGKTIKAKTNKKGVAKLTIKKSVLKKLKAGKKYRYTVTYLKTTVKKTVKVKK